MALGIASMVVDEVGGDAHQPSPEGDAAPFEAWQLLQRAKEHAGRDIFGDRMVLHPSVAELIHLFDVAIVEASERVAVAFGPGD
jgi:hypothetical protein